MSISQNFPAISPSLSLNFARSKTLDPRITFARPSTSGDATYMNENGLIVTAAADEPRFDHKYENGVIKSLGLLVEEQRSNLILSSENQNNWGGFRTTVSIDQIFSPDGNMTADLITASETSVNGGARLVGFTPSVGTFTFSVFAKKNTTSTLLLRPQSTNFSLRSDAYFDLETGEKAGVSDDGVVFTNSTQDIEDYGNDWYRCSVTFTLTSVNFDGHVRIYVVDNSGSFSVTSGASFYIWGAQLEEGAFPTSYIPTEGSAKTRSPDNVSMTGTNFTDWYNQDEGTVYVSQKLKAVQDDSRNNLVYLISDGGGSSGYFYNTKNGTTNIFAFADGGTSYSRFQDGTDSTDSKTAWAYDVSGDDFKAYYNGIEATTETDNNTPSATSHTQLELGATSGDKYCGHISQLTYYPRRLTNDQLQSLTK